MTASQDSWSLPTTSAHSQTHSAVSSSRRSCAPGSVEAAGRRSPRRFTLDTMAEGAERFYEAMAELPSLRIDARAV